MRNHDFKEVGAQIGDSAHQQPAGRSAFDCNLAARAVFIGHQVLGAIDEVSEGVHLVHHAPGIMPGLAQIAAAADMRVSHHYSAIEQREPAGAEGDGKNESI